MSSSKVTLKNPPVAAFLAFLVPGLGHFYQGRNFKGVLYLVCICGIFFAGMRIGDGKVVYFDWAPEKQTWAYLCQFWTGLPALPALANALLRPKAELQPNYLPTKLSAPFVGTVNVAGEEPQKITGQINFEPQEADGFQPRVAMITDAVLTTKKGETKIDAKVYDFSIDPRIAPDPRRRVTGMFEGQIDGQPEIVKGNLQGSIPRSLWDAYEAPLQDRKFFGGEASDLDRAHEQLGTRFELGVVYTMIAGLLNILAIYDALEGPAYGDEEEELEGPGDQKLDGPT